MPALEARKKELAYRRNLIKPLTIDELKDHASKYN